MAVDPREYARRYREKNREAILRRRAELRREKVARDRANERAQRYHRENREAVNLRRAEREHGPDYSQMFAAMWNEQHGRCYLCGREMVRSKAVVDHDHACCPPRRSCAACRRGLACNRCNALIGQLGDDPEVMRRIADNLEVRAGAARVRIAAKPVQLEMGTA